MIFLFQIILINFKFSICQWIQLGSYLTAVKNFSTLDTGGFIKIIGGVNSSSQYIDCSLEGSYIVLNTTQSEVYNNISNYWNYQKFFVTFDLIFFQGWTDPDYVDYTIGSSTFNFQYNSTQIKRQFCENQQAQYQVFNKTFNANNNIVSGSHKFYASTSAGSVAIKNHIITGLRCSPNCKTCSGGSINQCLSCFITSDNSQDCRYQCPPETPYFVNNYGCFKQCWIDQALYLKVSCVAYPINFFVNLNIYQNKTSQQYRWQPIYNENQDFGSQQLNNIAFDYYYIYGIFKLNQGYQSVVSMTYGSYLIGIKIDIILFNQMPDQSSISLQINETYRAHIYNDGSGQGQKFDQFIIQYQSGQQTNLNSLTNEYNNYYYYTLYMYANVSKGFTIKLIGNYPQSSNAGWAIRSIYISSGQCPQYCLKCESLFQCSLCKQYFFIQKSGTCSTCQEIYQQKINTTHCLEFDDKTPYTEYLVKEFKDLTINLDTYQLYQLQTQNGDNFYKGEGIFYSIWKEKYRIFGGPYIWAQARFQRIYDISRPHHSVSFFFIIIFGPSFPEDGQFIFYLDNQIKFDITSANQEIVIQYEYQHTASQLTVDWECKGSNNEPIQAYCGFYQYYLTVHYCQPGCSGSCTNQNDCIGSINTIICSDGQYLDIYKNQCNLCSQRCKRCSSLQSCLECMDGYIDPSLGCICDITKFQDTNGCSDCPQDCNQCINLTFCLECKVGSYKVLKNNECVCQDGYFVDSNLGCSICKSNCKICTTNSDCSECVEGFSIVSPNECQLNTQYYYSSHLQKKFDCPTSGICNPCQSNVGTCNCGDQIIYDSEDCDDGNQIEYDGCHNCQFQCQKQCTKCINGKCIECATYGYYLDINTQTCQEQCYDGIIIGKEQCDDANGTQNCNNCRFFCYPDCQQCDLTQGKCTTCREGLVVNENYCKNVCGDSIIVQAPDINLNEECDDGNQEEFDGCNKKCEFQCQIQTICLICQDRKCQYCQYGYLLNQMINKCECGSSCLNCDFLQGIGCIQCKYGYELRNKICYPICGDSYITTDEQCDDGNMNIEDGCHQCLYTCEQTCQLCLLGQCLECDVNYYVQNGRCILLMPLYLDKSEGVDVYNTQPQLFYEQYYYFVDQFEDCIQNHNKKYISYLDQVYMFHRIRIDLQGYEVSKYHFEEYEQICPINCLSCFHGLCISCKLGYHLDLVNNVCNPICGDQYITIEELCDDGNNIIQDGCYNCQYQCQEECTNCLYGICKSCIQSYFFDIKKQRCVERTICIESQGYYYDEKYNNCYPKCGDHIKAGKEQCDDGNDTPYDGCYECQYQCEQLCQTCQQGKCVNCQIGYKLSIPNSICINDCGDGLIFASEQCDDANSIVRDGCTNCQIDPGYKCITLSNKSYCYTCKSNCNQCEYINGQINCINCIKGYFLTSNECIKCSDQCEECLNSPNNCIKCKLENCQKCDNKQGLYSDYNLKTCITKCGDLIVAGKEQCDDGNKINNDGCNSLCEFEQGFQCSNNMCQKIEQKQNIEFNYTNSTTTNCLQLKGDLDFKSICPKITIEIHLFETHEFKYLLTPFEFNQTQIKYGCEISFEFFKTITETNLIYLTIPLNTNGSRLLEEYKITIIPRKQIYYNEEQKEQAQDVVAASNQFQFLLQLIGPLSIILGGVNFFWTILEILTWINNFYFLNIEYPFNVKIFFQQFKWDDIFFIPDFISLNTPNDPFYFQAPLKFQEKNVNPLFINNIQIFICLIAIATIIYFISTVITQIYKIKLDTNQLQSHKIYIFTKCQSQLENQQSTQNKQNKTLTQKIQELPLLSFIIIRSALEYQYNFQSKVYSIINLLLLDLFMACILQLSCPKHNNYHYIIIINNVLAVCFLILTITIYYTYIYVSTKHYSLLNHSIFKRKYLSIYEVLNYQNKIAMQYCYFNLVRKFSFILFIVLLYEKPIIQTTFCCLSCFMNLAFLFYQNPFNSKSVFIQTGIPEFCIFFIVSLAVLIAFDDMNHILNVNSKELIGWIIIFLISLSVAVQLIFMLIEFYHKLKSNCEILKNLICPQNKQS